MNNQILTQEELRKYLSYDESTGLFIRLVASQGVKVGDVAGAIVGRGYIRIQLNFERYYAHRLAWFYMYGEFPVGEVDHIDGDRKNNRISNLRVCLKNENLRNAKIRIDNKSGFRGVSWNKRKGRWSAQAAVDKKQYYLGYFTTPEAASAAYQAFAKKHHGEFYRAPNILS